MGRPLRTLDDAWLFPDARGRRLAIFEVSFEVVGGLHLLLPDARCAALLRGVVGRAQTHWDFALYAYAFAPTEGRLLIGVTDLAVKAEVLAFVESNISKEIKLLRGWFAPVVRRRNDAVQVTTLADLEERVTAMMAASTADRVVGHPAEDPYVSATSWLLTGAAPEGVWVDRTALGEARRRGRRPTEAEHSERVLVALSRLPHLRDLAEADHQAHWAERATAAARRIRVGRKKAGQRVTGVPALLALDPFTRRPLAPGRTAPVVWGPPAHAAGAAERNAERRQGYSLATAALRAFQAGRRPRPLRWPAGTLAPVFARAPRKGPQARAGPAQQG